LGSALDGVGDKSTARLETGASGPKSSTIRPPERTSILLNADNVEARWDTTIMVEADR